MVEISKKRTTRVFARNSHRELLPVPQRELKKRKSVRFEEEPSDNAVATSDFVAKTNQEWTFVASCFNLHEENRNENPEDDKELIVLCNYFDKEDERSDLNDDSDDSIPCELFAEQGMRISYQIQNPTVSTLQLSSMLRLESCQQNIFDENENQSERSFLEITDNLEDAFHGRLSCSNSQKVTRSRRSSTTEEKHEFELNPSDDDFWSAVEF